VAIGVRTQIQADPPRFVDVIAKKGIYICTGAIASPALLQRSGIGDPALLAPLGIPTVFANVNVGRHLVTHYGPATRIPALFENPPPFALVQCFSDLSGTNLPPSDGLRRLQFLFAPGIDGENLVIDGFNWLLEPEPIGSVGILSTDPNVDPLVTSNFYTAPDLARAVKLLKMWANISLAYTSSMPISPPASFYPVDEYPLGGAPPGDNSRLEAYAKPLAINDITEHFVGTCRMGANAATAVVDGKLDVFGVSGLSVVCNAIQPVITTGNTSWPAYIIGLLKAKIDGASVPF
jgi:choline dehydrogenase